MLALPSNGLHTNGYSLARKLLFDVAGRKLDEALAAELLRVHRSYLKPLRKLIEAGLLKGAAHITGGGITDNVPRILPKGLATCIETARWTIPPFFEELREIGKVPLDDYRRTFNLGVGMVLAVGKSSVSDAGKLLARLKEPYFEVGDVVKSSGARVIYV